MLALLALFSLPIFAEHVDVEVARTVARSFWEQNLGKQTRATFSDVSSQTEFTNFYIFNTSDGFVIVSADDIAVPILGYSDSGNFDPENIPVNMHEWLLGYEHDISLAISNGVSASSDIATDWRKLSSGQMASQKRSRSVNALVQTRWDQGSPYNTLCPYDSDEGARTVTGCVATAMAQIMKYWNYPTQGNGSQTYTSGYGELTANFGQTTYDWNNMVNSYTNSATQAQKDAVATLMYHCGVAVQMSYGVSRTGGSGAVTVGPSNGTAEYAMENFFLYKNTLNGCYRSNYSETEWKNMLIADLDAGRPVIYTGRGDGGGHCFICDGYNNNNQFHFNWGWGGYCDGFYAINSMEPGTGGIGSGNGTYNESQSAIFGIEPNAGLFAIPNALTFSGLGGSETFMVRSSTASSQSWTAASSQSWLTISPATGAGSGANTTVTATASRNNTASERTATITITQGSATTTVTVVQPSGIANDPGCFGEDGNSTMFRVFEPGNMIVVCGEGFGYYTTGHQITKVNFTTYDGGQTGNYSDYTNNSFTIKIYEGGSTESLGGGYTSNIARAMGTQVYSQNYTQSYYGDQEVVLNTPYTINENTNFWIAIVANGKTLFMCNKTAQGSPIAYENFSGSADAFDGKYLFTDTDDGTDYLNLATSANYTDDSHSYLQLYSLQFLLSFCTIDPSLLMVTPETLNFNSEGGNMNFTIKANANVSTGWTASSSASWLTLSATSGSGNGATTTVTATASENLSGSDRNATITVTQGSETKVITVTQPDGSFAETNRWYGNNESNIYTPYTSGHQVIIRPENYGNYEEGSKILKVKFFTYNGLQTTNYTDYINTNFTIKIYEGSNVDYSLTHNGYTTDINTCLGSEVYSQNYTAESFSGNEYSREHTVDLETPYTIRNGVNFWIAVVANGNTLFLYKRQDVGDPVDASSYTTSMGVAAASGNYLYTTTSGSTEVLMLNYSAYYVNNRTEAQTATIEYKFSYYVSDGDTPYVESSDLQAWLLDDGVSPHYDAETNISIGATDDIIIYPVVNNSGPETTTGTISTTIKVGSETIEENTYNISLDAGYFVWLYPSPYSYTITAEQLNQMVVTGTFDVCFHANYSGFDPNLSNNTTCITVTRATPTFTITASANPTAGGSVTGAGTYDLGEGVNLVATPNAGYRFTSWTENGTVVSTNATYQFTASANRTLVANFTQRTYNVTATVDPDNSGTISGNNSPYNYGANVSLTATANNGYSFVNWTENGNIVSTNAEYSFTATANRTLIANFATITYTITASANPTEGGTVNGSGNYASGQTVNLNAIANTGYNFTNWTENGSVVSTNAEYSFTAAADRTLIANFELVNYTISAIANPVDGGTINGTGDYTYGQTVNLSAVANTGYTFVNWTENDTEVSTDAEYSFTATGNRNLVANFQINTYNVSASANPTDGGTVSGAGDYTHGQTATLTAVASTGYHFVNWTENGAIVSTDAEYSFTVTADRTLVANFELISYTISATANPTDGGTIAGAGDYNYGQTVTLTATANTGYNFVNWTEDGAVVTTNTEYSFTATEDRTFVANFEAITYTISATANPTNGGTVSGDGDYTYGQNVTLSATANTGYHFVNWTENDTEVSANAEYSFGVTADRTLVANFSINRYHVTATANDPAKGSVTIEEETIDGMYDYGTVLVLTATATEGNHFVAWNDGVTDVQRQYTVVADENFVATFAQDGVVTYIITATANPTEGGTITGAGPYEENTTVTLNATANEDYNFVNWTENDEVVSTDVEYTFTATDNRTLVANFEAIPATTYTITVEVGEFGTVTYNGEDVEGEVIVEEGSTPAFVITPYEHYAIETLTIDGEVVVQYEYDYEGESEAYTYTFEPVMTNHTLSVTFTFVISADMIEAGSMSVYPNPNNGLFTLSMESIEGDVTCQIVNTNGSIIETREINASDNSEIVFDCNVAPGVYFVRIISGDRVWTESVVISR